MNPTLYCDNCSERIEIGNPYPHPPMSDHAMENCRLTLQYIIALMDAKEFCMSSDEALLPIVEGRDLSRKAKRVLRDHGYDGTDPYNTAKKIEQTCQELPLSVVVRSGWYCPGSSDRYKEAVEFEILLSTGGPACRITGDLNCGNYPSNCRVQWQDWGTPWTTYDCSEENGQLDDFCSLFYFDA